MAHPDQTNLGAITIPGKQTLIPAVLGFALEVSQIAGFSRQECNKLQLALEEACVEAITNSFGPDEDGALNIRFLHRENGIEIHVHDMGLPYDPASMPVYEPGKGLDQDLTGIGSYLIRQMVDEYRFNNLGINGKETVLVKFLQTPIISGEKGEVVPEEPAPAPAEVIQKIPFTVRVMKPAESLEVCRCIYDCYGYSYASENVYYPERIRAMNEEGKLLSLVAVTDSQDVGGHAAIIFHDFVPAEFAMVVTKKVYRGQGIARNLGDGLVAEAIRRNLKGLQVKEVTAHPYTQKFCAKLGYQDCGILLGHSPKSLSFKGIADKLRQRNSDVLGFRYFQEPEPVSLYAPGRHRAIIDELLANIGLQASFLEPEDSACKKDRTAMNVRVHPLRSLAEIGVFVSGSDYREAFRQEMRKLFIDEIRVFECYLGMEDPMTPTIVSFLEEEGFVFTGVLPETDYGTAIVMQYFNGVHIELDELVIVSDMAKKLLAYIRATNPKFQLPHGQERSG